MEALKNRRLKQAIVVLTVVLSLLVCASVFLSYLLFNRQLQAQLESTNIELLHQIDHKLALMLKNIDKSTIQLLKSEEVVRFFDHDMNDAQSQNNAYRIATAFSNVINSDEYIFSIDLYAYGKRRLFSGNEIGSGEADAWYKTFESFDGYYTWLPTRKLPISRASVSIYRSVVTLVRTYPLLHSPGARRGAIAVNIKEDMLYSLIRNTSAAAEGETFIVDRDGVVVLHEDKRMLGERLDQVSYIRDILGRSNGEGAFRVEIDGADASAFYLNSEYTGWKIVRLVPEAQLNKPLEALRNGLLAIAAALFVIAAILAVMVGRWTFKPVNRFLHAMSHQLTAHPKYKANRKIADEFVYLESTVKDILSDSESLYKQVNESKPMLKWQLLTELLSDYRKNFKNVVPYMDLLGIRLYSGSFIVMCAEFDDKSDFPSSRDMHLYAYALCNVAEELINAETRGVAVELDRGTCAVIISFDDGDAERHVMRAVAVADLMRTFVQEYFKRTITVGIGEPVDSINDIHASYQQASEALAYKLVLGGNSIITRDDIAIDSRPQFNRLFAATDGILDAFRLGDSEKLRRLVERWFDSFAEHNAPPEMIKQLIVHCLMKSAAVAGEIGVDTETWFPNSDVYDVLQRYERLGELRDFLTEMLDLGIAKVKEKRGGRERNDTIDRMLRYIQEHYMRSDLSLNLLADEFSLSVSYLSKMFKEQMECNFIDYVMDIRMCKAKELVERTDEKIRDIAEKVGYTNVNSFVRIFKKSTGLTPSEYRERKKETPRLQEGTLHGREKLAD